MGTILALLLAIVSTNPMVGDKPTLYVDGMIEINHKWDEDKGDLTFDQVIIWEYNPYKDRYDILHWQMIKDGREIDRVHPLLYKRYIDKITSLFVNNNEFVDDISWRIASEIANAERQRIKDEIAVQKKLAQLEYAKANKDFKPEDFIIFHASKWLGGRRYGSINFNHNTQMYETIVEVQGFDLHIHAKHFKESDTLFDPEIEYKSLTGKSGGSTRMSKHPYDYEKKK